MSTLYLYSPLPPQPTGTADYVENVLEELSACWGPTIANRIVLVDDLVANPKVAEEIRSTWTVRDHREVQPESDDPCVYFIAANAFHRFVVRALIRHGSGRCYVLVHDLSLMWLLRDMVVAPPPLLGRSEMVEAAACELGKGTEWLLDQFDFLDEVARPFVMGQGFAVRRARRLFVHSFYAKSRLLLETVPGTRLPPVTVVQHPRRPRRTGEDDALTKADGRFTVGSFGFFSPIKRFDTVLRGFAAFYASLSPEDRETVRLVIGGEMRDEPRKRVILDARRHGCLEALTLLGFLSENDLHGWLTTADLIVALRFPSCGETSGIVNRAIDLGKRLVLTRFAAFTEEPCTYAVSADPLEETMELADALRTEFSLWKAARGSGTVAEKEGVSVGRRAARKRVFGVELGRLLGLSPVSKVRRTTGEAGRG